MKKLIAKFLLISLFCSLPSFGGANLEAAEEALVSDSEISLSLRSFDAVSGNALIDITISPGSQNINATQASLSFATSSLEISAVLTGSSFADYFLENSFDNRKGVLNISGMKPSPGISEKSLIAQVLIQKKSDEKALINISQEKSLVLANDGLGTNVLGLVKGLEIK